MNSNSTIWVFGGYRLDPGQRTLQRLETGEAVHLTARPLEALCLLLEKHGELVSKQELMRRLWPHVVVEESNLTQTIYALRQALGEPPSKIRFIVTEPGRGYRFVCPARQVADAPSTAGVAPLSATTLARQSPVAAAAAAGIPAPRSRRWWTWSFVAAASLAIVIIALGWWRWRAAATATVAPAQPIRSIAVLPFDNETGDAGKDYWGDGVAEELINVLSTVPGLKVPAQSSSFAYKGRNVDARQIAKELGVQAVVQGSVRSAGDRIRITAQLSDAVSGFVLWSSPYDRKLTDVLELQKELAAAIVRALQVKLEGGARPIVTERLRTRDVEAYRLTLQAFALLERNGPPDARGALDFFQRALARDPSYARAYAGIAKAYVLTAMHENSPQTDQLAAEQAARRSLQLDPNSAQAESVLGELAWMRLDMAAAEEHYRRAETLDSNDALIRFDHAIVEAYVGHLHEAVQEMREAYALAPAIPQLVSYAGIVHSWAGLDTEALRYADLAVTLGIPHDDDTLGEIRGAAALRAGRYADYLHDGFLPAPYETNADIAPAQELTRLVLDAVADPRRRAAARAARIRLYPPGGRLTRAAADRCGYNGTRAYVVLGDLDAAYALANQCLDEAPAGLTGGEACPWQPEWRRFRMDPRFQAYVARRGAIPYYEKYGPPDDCEFKAHKLSCH